MATSLKLAVELETLPDLLYTLSSPPSADVHVCHDSE